jgi:hypothetical protein
MTRAVPTITIEDCGLALPGGVLRLVVAVASAGIVGVLAVDGAPPLVLAIVGLVATFGVLSPGSAAPAALCGLAAIVSTIYANSGDGDIDGAVLRPTVFLLVFLVHLVHVSCGLAAVVPRGARLHVSALRRPLRRFLLIQAAVFALAGLVAVLPAGRNPAQLEVLAILGITGLAALAIVLLRR